jgi:leucyl/phenylalanyl-tRNA--protein transferase
VLRPSAVLVASSLRKRLRRGGWRIQADQAFPRVVRACARAPRPGQKGTWITRAMTDAYVRLHRLGYAHSIEVWRDAEGDAPQLVGGLYGVSVGRVFCGESMFHRVTDASKIAFVALARQLERWGFPLIDCQVPTPHLASLGARPLGRDAFLEELAGLVTAPVGPGRWTLDDDIASGALEARPSAAPGPPQGGRE